ncbi:MAG TPA: hypothetical protein VMV49_17650 [Candidatus Deferrimicrobium sp.]|nr:hypothetical protein [Candidatus Deferrimicrobium sp.]
MKEESATTANHFICTHRREEYTPYHLVFELAFLIPTFLIGILVLYWFSAIGITFFFGLWCFLNYFIVFRLVLCPNCYYYGRWCPDGMGKYAKKVFNKKGDVTRYKKALIIPTIGWSVILAFPIVICVISFIRNPHYLVELNVGALTISLNALWGALLYAIFILLYFAIHIRLSCRGCAHRECCNLLSAFRFLKPLANYPDEPDAQENDTN